MDPSFVAKRLRAYRKLKHLTQSELAALLGVSVAVIGGIERGTRHPSPKLLEDIWAILEISEADWKGTAG